MNLSIWGRGKEIFYPYFLHISHPLMVPEYHQVRLHEAQLENSCSNPFLLYRMWN